MIVLENLLINEGRSIWVSQGFAVIILVESWHYLSNIISWNSRKSFSIEILDQNFWPSLILNVNCNEVLESIEFINNKAFMRLNQILPWVLKIRAWRELVILKCSQLIIFWFDSKVSDHNKEVSQVIDVSSNILSSWYQLSWSYLRLISIDNPYLWVLLSIRVDNQIFSIFRNPNVYVMRGVSIDEYWLLLHGVKVHFLHFVGSVHRISLNVVNGVSAPSELYLADTFELNVLENLIFQHIFDTSS